MIPETVKDYSVALEIARQLDGMRVADAVAILDTARELVSQASVTMTREIPPK